jgi:hypothetical protein
LYIPRKKAKRNDVMAPSGIGQKRRDEHPFYQKRECSVFEMVGCAFCYYTSFIYKYNIIYLNNSSLSLLLLFSYKI